MKIKILTLKKFIKLSLVLGLLFLFAAFPNVCITGAINGFKTSVFSVLPSILPFMILSKYIIYISNGNNKITALCSKIFNISPQGMNAVILGSIAGYPAGATLLCDQVKKKEYQRCKLRQFSHTPTTAALFLL